MLALNEFLSDIGNKLKSNDLMVNEYIITKQLTRVPEYYSDHKSLPHVAIALRQKAAGKSDTELVNNYIPYVICTIPEVEVKAGEKKQQQYLSDKAFTPDELLAQRGKLAIDTQWYIT